MLLEEQPKTASPNIKSPIDSREINQLLSLKSPQEKLKLSNLKSEENILSAQAGSLRKLMSLRMNKVTKKSLIQFKSAFYNLYNHSKQNSIQINFLGLEEYNAKYLKRDCCTWFSQHTEHPEREILQLMKAIQSQSKPSIRKYNIQLI